MLGLQAHQCVVIFPAPQDRSHFEVALVLVGVASRESWGKSSFEGTPAEWVRLGGVDPKQNICRVPGTNKIGRECPCWFL